MCFSAEASFVAGGVLAVVGVASVKNAKSADQIPFAAIPFLFAVQQSAEGTVWLGLGIANAESWRQFPIYIFLILAQVVWPFWVPLSVLLLEKNSLRRKIMQVILSMGVAISFYLLYCLFAYDVSAEIHSGHIKYALDFPLHFVWLTNIFYFVPTVIPLFICSIKKMVLLGIMVLISLIVAQVYFEAHLISVWCYSAAIISITIFWISADFRKRPATSLSV